MIRWAALLGGLVALSIGGSARAFVIDTRADERCRAAPDDAAPVDPACTSPQSTTGALLGDELDLLQGPGFVLVRGGLAVAEAACAAQPIATAVLSDTVQRVERALRTGDPALALALLGELDERFPESRLVEERLAARHMADCRLEAPDAVARARRFLDEHPLSVYRQRLQLACALGGDNPGLGPQR